MKPEAEKHDEMNRYRTAMGAMALILVAGCGRQSPTRTEFARDYAQLQPRIKECHSYYDSGQIQKAEWCLRGVGPLANKTVEEANKGDDQQGTQNIEANLMSADLNTLGSMVILREMRSAK